MAIKGSVERRAFAISIAARMLKLSSADAKPPTARELVDYAKTVDDYIYNGDDPIRGKNA